MGERWRGPAIQYVYCPGPVWGAPGDDEVGQIRDGGLLTVPNKAELHLATKPLTIVDQPSDIERMLRGYEKVCDGPWTGAQMRRHALNRPADERHNSLVRECAVYARLQWRELPHALWIQ